MKRGALLIGYSGWDLPRKEQLDGVSYDLDNYKYFLMSSRGGGWKEEEIKTIKDKELSSLRSIINEKKEDNFDVFFTVFSGHGDYENKDYNCRGLQISKSDDILENDLIGFADREILILDSCSDNRYSQEELIKAKARLLKESLDEDHLLSKSRRKYEKLCSECSKQTLRFYASEVGTSANDTLWGGLYSRTLLSILLNSSEELDMVEANKQAASKVIIKTIIENNPQLPDMLVPKNKNINKLPGNIII